MSVVTIDRDFNICADSDGFEKSPSGINCTFLKIGNTGLKCYKSEKLRDRSYANQHALSLLSVAPKVGLKTTVMINRGGEDCTYYAHETECAEVHDKARYLELVNNDYAAGMAYRNRFEDAASNLKTKLEGIITWFDNHGGNVGFDSDGNAMIIDCADDLFGDGSVDQDL